MADVKDLSRERISEIRDNVRAVEDGGDEAVHLAPGEWEALLSMASRCVSVETVRKLAEYRKSVDDDLPDGWHDFAEAAETDLIPAARSLIDQEGKANEKA